MALTETWLRDQLDAEVNIKDYTLFRQDRQRAKQTRRGRDSGGVAAYIPNDISGSTEPILEYTNGVVELLGLYIKPKNVLLFVIYRQPDQRDNAYRSTSVEFRDALGTLKNTLQKYQSPTPDIILCGDFNLPHAEWPHGTMRTGGTKDEKEMINDLVDLANSYFLTQLIQDPTHRCGNTLDLLFTNNPDLLHNYSCSETIYSDHYILECCSNYREDTHKGTEPDPPKSNYPGAELFELNFFSDETNWEEMNKQLQEHDWQAEFRALSTDTMLRRYIEVCTSVAKECVPLKKGTRRNKTNGIPRDRKNLMRRRSRINKQIQRATSDTRKTKLKKEVVDIEKMLKKSYDNDRQTNESKAVSAIKKNPKYFFSYAKKFSKLNSGVGPLFDVDNSIVTHPASMADLLSRQYKSVFTEPIEPMHESRNIFPDECTEQAPQLKDINFDEADIEEAIQELSATSAAGPDSFPALMLKKCSKALSRPLFLIWRKSLNQGTIPTLLKTGNIVPIHKGGSRGLPKQYRPVALTSHLIKIFEKVLRKFLISYLEENKLLNPDQHGFRIGRSCLSQLLSHFDHILKGLEEGKNVDIIYLDFAKAFDKVDFLVTLKKLKLLGITGKLGRWIHSFLTGRKQYVTVQGWRSEPTEVKSGVPQGSVLGPLLFLVLIGDINKEVAKSFVSSFADDTRVGHYISSQADAKALQADLNAIYKWATTNNMQFNSDKFECIRYGTDNILKENNTYVSDTGCTIETKETIKDLGVTISCDGTFKAHILNTVETAKKLCGWILRTFKTRKAVTMVPLFKSLVLSKLDYCCQLWSPRKKGDIQQIEMIQRSFLRKIEEVRHLNYWEQLGKLKMKSHERRRERYLIIYTWKVLEAQVPAIGGIRSSENARRGRLCIIPGLNNRAPERIRNLREASFTTHGPRLFNTLPAKVRNITGCSIDTFKAKLDRHLSLVPDEPQIQGYTAQRRSETNSLLDMGRLALHNDEQEGEDLNQSGTLIRGGHPWPPW